MLIGHQDGFVLRISRFFRRICAPSAQRSAGWTIIDALGVVLMLRTEAASWRLTFLMRWLTADRREGSCPSIAELRPLMAQPAAHLSRPPGLRPRTLASA